MDHPLLRRGIDRRPRGFDREPEAPDENLDATRLVDEVDRSALERQAFVVDQGPAGQEDDGQVDVAPA